MAAFDHYIQATEARMAEDLAEDRFLIIDRLPDGRRQQVYAQVRQGQIHIEELHTKEDGRSIRVPSGLIHDWTGVMFIRGATLAKTLAVLQDYENHKNIYKPDVRESKLLETQRKRIQGLFATLPQVACHRRRECESRHSIHTHRE